MKKKTYPEDLVFEEWQFDWIQSMIRNRPTMDRRLVQIRDYIIEHIDEDITPKSVIEKFGMPYKDTCGMFTIRMGESMSSMIRRLKAKRAAENANSGSNHSL